MILMLCRDGIDGVTVGMCTCTCGVGPGTGAAQCGEERAGEGRAVRHVDGGTTEWVLTWICRA